MITPDTPGVADVIMPSLVHSSGATLARRCVAGQPGVVPDLSALGAASLGVWTRPQARRLLTAGAIDTFVRSGAWQVLWRGVYMDGGLVPTAEQRALACALAAGGAGRPGQQAVACGRTAARVWQLPLIDDDDPATGAAEHRLDHVAVARRLPPQSHRGRLLVPHRMSLAKNEVVRLRSGLRLTTALQTLVHCSSLLTHEALVCALDFALHHELVTVAELAAAVDRCAGRAGGPALRRAVAVADGRAESPAETLARLLLLPVLPGLEPQVRLFDGAARLVARFDLGDRSVRLAVEADGRRGHAGTQMVAKDRRRDRTAEGLGWATERVTWFELRRRQAAVVRRMLEVHSRLSVGQPAA